MGRGALSQGAQECYATTEAMLLLLLLLQHHRLGHRRYEFRTATDFGDRPIITRTTQLCSLYSY